MCHPMSRLYSWQLDDWPNFSYNASELQELEQQFLYLSGVVAGVEKAVGKNEKAEIVLTFLSNEALKTSEIEGELLDRESVQSSIQSYFEEKTPRSKNFPRENGIAKMMVDLFLRFDVPLSHEMLFEWHRMLMNGRTDLEAIGQYRFSSEPMKIVSGEMGNYQVHYEAPPSKSVFDEMDAFILWFNKSQELSPLIRAGIAHLYFERIHPFEDGNGRIGRVLIQKSLAQSMGHPLFIALSQIMLNSRDDYYAAFQYDKGSNEITNWLNYCGKTIVEAQNSTLESIQFIIRKTHFYDRYASQLNERQHKLIRRIFQEDVKGFTGGVSVKNYRTITSASASTANRDLNSLVAKGIMKRTGDRKTTRYWLNL